MKQKSVKKLVQFKNNKKMKIFKALTTVPFDLTYEANFLNSRLGIEIATQS